VLLQNISPFSLTLHLLLIYWSYCWRWWRDDGRRWRKGNKIKRW